MTSSKNNNKSSNKTTPDTSGGGWVGGFAESNPDFEYSNPDLSSLPLLGNSENIEQLERQMKVLWPEFSWQTEPGDEDTRCYQKFTSDICRLAYTKEGKIETIVYPIEDAYTKHYGPFSVEVRVTGQRGWVNENARPAEKMAGDMTVVVAVWFTDSSSSPKLFMDLHKYAQAKFPGKQCSFPISRDTALQISTHKVGNSKVETIPFRTGVSERFKPPGFTCHDEAFTVSNLEFEIGNIIPSKNTDINSFNQAILDLFNSVQRNMLKAGNIVTWNLWFGAPTIVDQKEWKDHIDYLRNDIDHYGTKSGNKLRNKDARVCSLLRHQIDTAEKRLVHYTDQAEAVSKGVPYRRDVQSSGSIKIHDTPAPGWIGGFVGTNLTFAYPERDLSSLPVLDNMDNIDQLQRQMKVLWPEFSWQSIPGEESSRCFQMFAPDISRIGYNNEGRVFSIVCPQQGRYSDLCGTVNIEITVTGQRGWANEDAPNESLMAADLSVVGQIWFGPHALDFPAVNAMHAYANRNFKGKKHNGKEYKFPLKKADAIRILTNKVGDKDQELFSLRTGLSDLFKPPAFTRHDKEAFAYANLSVEIGDVEHNEWPEIVAFNRSIVDLLNAISGNMLAKENVLTWNVWFEAPTHVCVKEWRLHANKWRESLEVNHCSPGVQESEPMDINGELFNPNPTDFNKAKEQLGYYINEGKQIIGGILAANVDTKIYEVPVPGWIGGFVKPDTKLAYPDPDLTSLSMDKRSSDINKIERQMRVMWPEFSWLIKPGDEDSRVFQKFAQDISRIGYTREGEVISILSPERSTYYPGIGSVNIEVQVTRVRGWVNESSKGNLLAADMSVRIRVWVVEDASIKESMVRKMRYYAAEKFKGRDYNFPISRETAIIVNTYRVGHNTDVFPLRSGLSPNFEAPDFTNHTAKAFGCCHLNVEIGDIDETGHPEIDSFNKSLMEVINVAKGNILLPKSVLTWNIWFEAPTLVDKVKWTAHEKMMRINAERDHATPDDPKNRTRFANGDAFYPEKVHVDKLKKKFQHYINEINQIEEKGINYVPAPDWGNSIVKARKEMQYPNPKLTFLNKMPPELARQMKLTWPEVSWRIDPSEEDTRCFQTFAPDISRIGYNNTGVIKSILGPQGSAYSAIYGALNVELTVTEQIGWIDENDSDVHSMAADISIVGSIWFSEHQVRTHDLQALKKYFYSEVAEEEFKFPDRKEHAIIVETFKIDNYKEQTLSLRSGLSERFEAPKFIQHKKESWTKSYVDFEIGKIRTVDNEKVNAFNKLILRLFNALKGNMLLERNTVTCNLWFEAPAKVTQERWDDHVVQTTKVNHSQGCETKPKYANESDFNPPKAALSSIHNELEELVAGFK